jgi:predicted HTH domain antitoxin
MFLSKEKVVMSIATIISRTDLARRTRQVVDQARRGGTVIVESYGEEQVAIMDAHDYHLLRAVAAYHIGPSHSAPISDEALAPRGLEEEIVERAVAEAGGDVQIAWNQVITAYLDGDISLGRAAELLGFSRFELAERCNRLDIPLQLGPANVEEAKGELEALRQ